MEPPADPVSQILSAMSNRYRECHSYRDEGSISTQENSGARSSNSNLSFQTFYKRPGRLKFEFLSGIDSEISSSIICQSGKVLFFREGWSPSVSQHDTLAEVFDKRGMLGPQYNAAGCDGFMLRIPMLLDSNLPFGFEARYDWSSFNLIEHSLSYSRLRRIDSVPLGGSSKETNITFDVFLNAESTIQRVETRAETDLGERFKEHLSNPILQPLLNNLTLEDTEMLSQMGNLCLESQRVFKIAEFDSTIDDDVFNQHC